MRNAAPVLMFVVTEDWYFVSHRLALAQRAVSEGFRVIVATRVSDHGETIRHAGCELISLRWRRRGGSPLGEIATLVRLVKLYRRYRPTVVHHVALKPVIYGSLAARIARVPGIVNAVTGLGYVFTAPTSHARLLRGIMRVALRMAFSRTHTTIIVQNPDDEETLLQGGLVRADQTRLIRGSGVDLDEFHVTDFPDGVPTVVLASRMLWDKGVGEFVEAAKTLRAQGVAARFVLVGDTDPDNPRAVPRTQLSQWHESGVVEWWGHRSDMAAVFAGSHVVCLPSTYGEGIPKVLIEAASAGRPIVATDAPGCREIVQNGENGLLVPMHDPVALGKALRTLIGDHALRREMGARGRRLVEDEFTIERVLDDTMAVYRELLS